MKITIQNYDQHILDFTEGNLTPDLHGEMVLFLEENPDIAETLYGFDEAVLIPDETVQINKTALKKNFPYSSEAFEPLCIANAEGEIDPTLKHEIELQLDRFPEEKAVWLAYVQTVLKPDTSVVFPDKATLKKTLVVGFNKKYIYAALSVAAAFLLFFSLIDYSQPTFENISNLEDYNQNQLAINDSMPIPVFPKRGTKITLPYSKEEVKKVKKQGRVTKTKAEQLAVVLPSGESPNSSPGVLRDATYAQFASIKHATEIKTNSVAFADVLLLSDFSLPEMNKLNPSDFESYDQYLQAELRKKLFNVQPGEKINYWAFAEASVLGVNRVLGANLKMKHDADEAGKTKGFSIGSRMFSVERK